MNETPILGPGPHTLRMRATLGSYIGGLLTTFLGLGIVLGFGIFQTDAISALMEESNVWENGTVAADAGIDGEVTTTQLIFDSYKLGVQWIDANGQYQQSEQEFATLFDGIEEDDDVVVRYLPTDEGYVIATSWSESVRTSRWTAIAFLLIVGLLMGGVFIWLGVAIIRKALLSVATMKDFGEVWLRIVHVVATSNNGVVTHTYTLFDEERNKEIKQGFTKEHRPLALGPESAHVLALRKRGGEFLLILRNDLYPLDMTPTAAADIQARAARPR